MEDKLEDKKQEGQAQQLEPSTERDSDSKGPNAAHLGHNPPSGRGSKRESKALSLPKTKDQVKATFGVYIDEVEDIRTKFGANIIVEEKKSKLLMLLSQFTGTMPVMIEIAMILTAVLEKWDDFAIIAAMLLVNAFIGFHHESQAANALEQVENKLSAAEDVQVFRKKRGKKEDEVKDMDVNVDELVVGDLAYIRAGDVIPADGVWVFGDELHVNEASLTGETRPRKVPQEDSEGSQGSRVLKGSTLVQGEGFIRITEVGAATVIGEANTAMNESTTALSPLQQSIQQVVNWIVAGTVLIVIVILVVQLGVRGEEVRTTLLAATGLIVAAVPVALPLVVSVTLAIGATSLAAKGAIISHLSAMQDLASMDVLCSDKTGTLTTAEMTINVQKIWLNEAMKKYGISKENIAELAALCSTKENAKKNEIESSVFRALEEVRKAEKDKFYDNYNCDTANGDVYYGFNANVKRTFCTVSLNSDSKLKSLPQKLKISKGLLTKVLRNDTKDDTGDMKWTVQDYKNIATVAKRADEDFGKSGYKTLAVAVDYKNAGPGVRMELAGILPIKDPPRASTEETIRRIRGAMINVKMVTGDHENIARNLAKDIHLGTNFLVHEDLWPVSAHRNELIADMDGIAQVTPKDKHEVVAVLQDRGHVIGMCGDGVNDAPALKLANVGFAVPGATQAARNAADIVLTEGDGGENAGLKVIYDAIVISREIFQRIKAYVLYRFASSVLIIAFLAFLTFVFNDIFNPLYVILLAIINDVTVTPIASDYVIGTKGPSELNVWTILGLSTVMGILLAIQSIGTFYGNPFGLEGGASQEEVAVYLQISITSQFLIFICRTEKPFFMTVMPHWILFSSCCLAQLMVSLWCGFGVVVSTSVPVTVIVYTWLYSFAGLLISDVFKCEYYHCCEPELYPNLYYSWIFCCGAKAKDNLSLMEEGYAANSSRLQRKPSRSIARKLTGLYIQKGHPANLTPAMQNRIRRTLTEVTHYMNKYPNAVEYKRPNSTI
eukprot:CAMPEP_0167762832 /NCGR_PEP_ID=MMETSP0110_2-20121227/13001_1 /TAXON_ID=629695 /ORGANISM="Gymnochlora sp., Strain CCMP2014" /LENGTH=1005 /DNA_ID=CAMNT_0007649779 /DNA_START=73 /DNA_END=3090 /DNA_ORIENTATION=-